MSRDDYRARKAKAKAIRLRRAVKHGLQASAYFNKDTFARVFPAQA